MKQFLAGFLMAGLLGCGALMVQKVVYEKRMIHSHSVIVEDNYKQRDEIRRLWKDNLWLRSMLPKDWRKHEKDKR